MNYYEHHIGDYDKNTSHLTACEDGIYSRLIRRYYDKEAPLPADVKEVQRLARARERQERDAVVSILREFFHLESDGWHHDKCDEVIAAFQAGEPEREAKKKNEDTRLARHRAERADLFSTINGAGQHMAWNTPMADLRAAAARILATAPATPETPLQPQPATPPATGTATPATATQTPLPTTHTPLPIKEDRDNTRHGPDLARVSTPVAVCIALKQAGLGQVNPGDPRLIALVERGATPEHFAAAVEGARGKRNPFAYLLAAVEGQIADAAAIAAGPKAPPASQRAPTRTEQRAATIAGLTGNTHPERTSHAAGSERAIDVDSRIVD